MGLGMDMERDELLEDRAAFIAGEIGGCRFNWSTQQLCENMGLRRFFE